MTRTYKAILRGNRLEWAGEVPELDQLKQEVVVSVTILPTTDTLPSTASDGKAMAEALQRLAASGALANLSDPVTWQTEQRQDRLLPGRDS
jgi:hypothetical protein